MEVLPMTTTPEGLPPVRNDQILRKRITIATITDPEMSKQLDAFIRRACVASANAMRRKGWERQLCDAVGALKVDFLILFGKDRDGRWRSKPWPNDQAKMLNVSRRWRNTLADASEAEVKKYIAQTLLDGLDFLSKSYDVPPAPPALRALAGYEPTGA